MTTPLAAGRCAAVGAGAPVAAPVAGAGAGAVCRRLLWEAAPSAWEHTCTKQGQCLMLRHKEALKYNSGLASTRYS